MRALKIWALAFVVMTGLAGCGGGGSSTTTLSFPLQAAVVNLYSTGFQRTAVISGTATVSGSTYPISGSVTVLLTPATTSADFEGQSALVSTNSISGSITINGQSVSISGSTQQYFSPEYSVLGYLTNEVNGSSTTGPYCVANAPGVFPATVSVGQTGSIANLTCYSDPTKTTLVGNESLSYAVSAGPTSSTATVALIDTFFPSGSGISSSQVTDNYVIDTSGNLTLSLESLSETLDGFFISLTMTAQ